MDGGQAARHAWRGYAAHAFGFDELRPLSRRGVNNFGGFGTTIVDSLGTLWLMDLTAVRASASCVFFLPP